jgi:putative spermidine/putrescine transport system permease protein
MKVQKTNRNLIFLLAPGLLVIAFVFIIPFIQLIVFSFWKNVPTSVLPEPAFTLENYYHLLVEEGPYYFKIYWNTIRIGTLATLLTLILAYPLSWHIARTKGMKKSIYIILIFFPLIGGAMIQTLGWLILLMPRGLFNGVLLALGIIQSPIKFLGKDIGIILAMAQAYMPMMILPLIVSLGSIDPMLEPAAKSLGAGPMSVFTKVIFPLSLPGAIAGSTLVFLSCLTSFVTPLILGMGKVPVFGPVAYTMGISVMNYPFASAFAFFPMVLALVAWLGIVLFRKIVNK